MFKALLISLTLASPAAFSAESQKDIIIYTANNDAFPLHQRCVTGVNLREDAVAWRFFPTVSLFLSIKKSPDCSDALDHFFSRNVGSDVTATFNSDAFLKTKIVSALRTGNGYSQVVSDKALATQILASYTRQ
ncbi:hypothetical protein EDF81_3896 [Enterobacter sp. BIGb0383]|uniref:hypothetical protein n=1 Tax=unclassified Enterobacter TaxID=2608935 RepID=UPI000F45F583|nr:MULTISPECIES: hypothetical protein [unclassified Enterobacter]ROP56341.1 hypothetical protein EDF81_3896 [Enterobacter sp. BIGb0383]ROS04407.1 hypothetical protein EC848_4037 [Enterobacter sp. BIGb0359]